MSGHVAITRLRSMNTATHLTEEQFTAADDAARAASALERHGAALLLRARTALVVALFGWIP